MKSIQLAKHYEKLTPMERYALIQAAIGRGDEKERQRLMQSAPQVRYFADHHWGVATAYGFLANILFMKLLAIAAGCFEALARFEALAKGADPGAKLGAEPECCDMWEEVLFLGYEFLGYEFKTLLAAWRQFCAELQFDPERRWSSLPGFDSLKRAELYSGGDPETGVAGLAFGAEEYARCLAVRDGHDPDSELDPETLKVYWPSTVADVVARLRSAWETSLEQGV
jgi:hypothetical protein